MPFLVIMNSLEIDSRTRVCGVTIFAMLQDGSVLG